MSTKIGSIADAILMAWYLAGFKGDGYYNTLRQTYGVAASQLLEKLETLFMNAKAPALITIRNTR